MSKKSSPTILSASLPSDAAVLVLVSCKATDDGDDDVGCVSQRTPFLDTYLASLGVLHKIVTTDDSFKTEMRSGKYNTYWISGGAKKLEDNVASELREAGFRGETVVIDGVHDERNKELDDVVGVLYKGKPAHLDTVTLTGTFLPAGTFTPSGAKPIRVVLTGRAEGPELDLAVPAIDMGAELPASAGIPKVIGNKERAAAFARALEGTVP